jgi:hypothetical protein
MALWKAEWVTKFQFPVWVTGPELVKDSSKNLILLLSQAAMEEA